MALQSLSVSRLCPQSSPVHDFAQNRSRLGKCGCNYWRIQNCLAVRTQTWGWTMRELESMWWSLLLDAHTFVHPYEIIQKARREKEREGILMCIKHSYLLCYSYPHTYHSSFIPSTVIPKIFYQDLCTSGRNYPDIGIWTEFYKDKIYVIYRIIYYRL